MQSQVLLLRKQATPTDDIYFLQPVQELIQSGRIELSVVDNDCSFRSKRNLVCTHPPGHVVISRYLPRKGMSLLRELKKNNSRPHISYIFDDDLAAAERTKDLPWKYKRSLQKVDKNQFQPLLKIADSLVTTSRTLYRDYHSQKTHLLEPGLWEFPKKNTLDPQNEGQLHIAYFATAMHRSDLEMIAPALQKLHNSYPWVKMDMLVSKKPLKSLAAMPRINFISPMGWPEYKKFLSEQKVHILLAPKRQTPFNRSKSFIKVLDAAQCGAVGVYSNVPPYSEVVEHGKNGFLVSNDSRQWYCTLSWLIENSSRILPLAEAGRSLAYRIGNPERLKTFWKSHLLGE